MSLYWIACACGQRMKVPEKALGTKRRCFKCGEWLEVSPEMAVSADSGAVPEPAPPLSSPPPFAREVEEDNHRSEAPQAPPIRPSKAMEESRPFVQEPHAHHSTTETKQRHASQGHASLLPGEQLKKLSAKLRIGELLVHEGLISQANLDQALVRQKDRGGKLVENLIALDFIDTRTFLNFMSKQPGTASIDLLNYTIPSEVIELVPAEFALKHELLPIDKMGRQLTVGMACPLDSDTVQKLVEMTGMKIRPLLVSMNDMRVALQQYYGPKEPRLTHTFKLPLMGFPPAASPAAENAAPEPPVLEPLAPEAEAPAPVESEHEVHGLRVEEGASGADLSAADEASSLSDSASISAYQTVLSPEEPDDASKFESVLQKVRQLKALPALHQTVRDVRAAMEDPSMSPLRIAEVIEHDPFVVARVLQLANSPEYGLNRNIDSVELATSLLGLREVYSLVLSAETTESFDLGAGFDSRLFWRRSLICSTAAQIVGKVCGRTDLGTIAAAGLLHDLGRAVLAEVVPEAYSEIDQRLSDNEVIEMERELFGVAHPEVGYTLARAWKLPASIAESMRFHHDFKKAQQAPDVVAIVALAALMTDTFGRIRRENVGAFAAQCKEMLNALQLTEKQFVPVLAEASAAIKVELRQLTATATEG